MYGAFYLLQVGRVEEAGQHIESALQEDPLNLLHRIQFGIYLLAAGRDADAAAHFHQVLDIDLSCPLALIWLCVACVLGDLSLVASPLFTGGWLPWPGAAATMDGPAR